MQVNPWMTEVALSDVHPADLTRISSVSMCSHNNVRFRQG